MQKKKKQTGDVADATLQIGKDRATVKRSVLCGERERKTNAFLAGKKLRGAGGRAEPDIPSGFYEKGEWIGVFGIQT